MTILSTKSFKKNFYWLSLVLLVGCFCQTEKKQKNGKTGPKKEISQKEKHHIPKKFTGRHVPILCYHALRDTNKDDSDNQKTYSVAPANFASQIKALSDHGYKSITPAELENYWINQTPLPEKPIMITFDDGRAEQYSIGAEILEKYHFKGVFFIMTVTIGKPHYMNQTEIKTLSDMGHIIGCHSWDHHKVTDYKKNDWTLQLSKPKKQLEKITQKQVTCFAYPYGVFNRAAADSVKSHGFTSAYTVYGKADNRLPLFTLPRIIVKNSATTVDFLKRVGQSNNDN
jgi:peptidoglycan/xylan/chitin deacetylase (PgdA/CDA1 family)